MTLNASGPISLAGTTAGQSIEVELGGNGTTQISLNCTSVRTLAGVPIGAIIMPTNFYGKSNNNTAPTAMFYAGLVSTSINTVTRINKCGGLIGSTTSVGTARSYLAGATSGAKGLYFGGFSGCTPSNLVTRINFCGALVGSETNAGTARGFLAGATAGTYGLFYAGGDDCSPSKLVTRINCAGALVGSETSVGTQRTFLAGAPVAGNAMFYGGYAITCVCFCTGTAYKLVTRINSAGALVGSETSVGNLVQCNAGAVIGTRGIFYGGGYGASTNSVTRISCAGALVGSITSVGTARKNLAGASPCSTAVFWGGFCTSGVSNTVTRINTCGALIGTQSSVGTASATMAGGATQ